jgi:hypothetical protein
MAGGTDDPLVAFIDRYVPRDLANVPGRYTVLRRQALRDLRELMAAEREACAVVAERHAVYERNPPAPDPYTAAACAAVAAAIRARGGA